MATALDLGVSPSGLLSMQGIGYRAVVEMQPVGGNVGHGFEQVVVVTPGSSMPNFQAISPLWRPIAQPSFQPRIPAHTVEAMESGAAVVIDVHEGWRRFGSSRPEPFVSIRLPHHVEYPSIDGVELALKSYLLATTGGEAVDRPHHMWSAELQINDGEAVDGPGHDTAGHHMTAYVWSQLLAIQGLRPVDGVHPNFLPAGAARYDFAVPWFGPEVEADWVLAGLQSLRNDVTSWNRTHDLTVTYIPGGAMGVDIPPDEAELFGAYPGSSNFAALRVLKERYPDDYDDVMRYSLPYARRKSLPRDMIRRARQVAGVARELDVTVGTSFFHAWTYGKAGGSEGSYALFHSRWMRTEGRDRREEMTQLYAEAIGREYRTRPRN